MSMFSHIGMTPRLVAAAAVSFSLFAGAAVAQNGFVEVRVRDDNAGCGPVVIKWPVDQEEREYDPNPAANDPKLEMAETRPLPVIHQHPALNAGGLYMPPQDGLYRHYFPESEAPPRLRRWIRPTYEEYLRDHNPSTDVPFAIGDAPTEGLGVPGTVIVPTGMTTPPATFTGTHGSYVAQTGAAPLAEETGSFLTNVPAGSVAFGAPESLLVQPAPVSAPAAFSFGDGVVPVPADAPAIIETIAPAVAPQPAAVVKPAATTDEGTGSFIHLSNLAEQIPFLGAPGSVTDAAVPAVQPAEIPAVPASQPTAPDTNFAPPNVVMPTALAPAFGEPADANAPVGNCGTPICK